ncbi:substrate-binding periplasmic protein [Zooshikella harenae]|uniref:Transporter substrate-binding domain-containing protein n=1 Tax=Zooshikella harenae TaxID=2827238 RepID=A0ABS5ZED4_9GAMM|nr:transporter substrate-binding domain-containing protein [Zooshikella harenae]MBU2712434.1 transporter substrate-binding domain-containing protein [Zooshikella harenae]
MLQPQILIFPMFVGLLWTTNVSYVYAKEVKICDDDVEYPPYTYYERINNKVSKKIIGITNDTLTVVFEALNLNYHIDHIPWKRCLFEVAKFNKRKRYEMFSTGSYTLERAEKYYVTSPFSEIYPAVFYSNAHFTADINVDNIEILQKFDSVCGVLGYFYKEYGLTRESDFIRVPTIIAGFKMLESNRCQIMPLAIQVGYGLKLIEKHNVPETIRAARIKVIKSETLHFFISKKSPRAFELYTKINHELLRLKYEGVLDEIHAKYETLYTQ